MLAVVFQQPNEYRLAEIPKPEVRSGQVLVQVKSTAICGTDVKILRGQVPFVRFPHIPGHEFGGQVVEVGEGHSDIQVGDKVGVEVHSGCGQCLRCVEGLYNLCLNYGDLDSGHAHIGFTTSGGLAEYCVVPTQATHRLPNNLDYDHGAFTDTLGIVLWAFERAGGIAVGENVVVVGPGALGLLAVQAACAFGAAQVIVVGADQDKSRLSLAQQMGADQIINIDEVDDPVDQVQALTGGLGADLVVEFAGTSTAGRFSIEIVRRGGRVVLGGSTSPGKQLEVDLSTIVRGHLDIYGSVANPRRISRKANVMMQRGEIDITPLMTHHMPLAEFDRAWDIFTNRTEDVIRIMMHPGENQC